MKTIARNIVYSVLILGAVPIYCDVLIDDNAVKSIAEYPRPIATFQEDLGVRESSTILEEVKKAIASQPGYIVTDKDYLAMKIAFGDATFFDRVLLPFITSRPVTMTGSLLTILAKGLYNGAYYSFYYPTHGALTTAKTVWNYTVVPVTNGAAKIGRYTKDTTYAGITGTRDFAGQTKWHTAVVVAAGVGLGYGLYQAAIKTKEYLKHRSENQSKQENADTKPDLDPELEKV